MENFYFAVLVFSTSFPCSYNGANLWFRVCWQFLVDLKVFNVWLSSRLSVYCEFVFLALFVFEMSVRMYALGLVSTYQRLLVPINIVCCRWLTFNRLSIGLTALLYWDHCLKSGGSTTTLALILSVSPLSGLSDSWESSKLQSKRIYHQHCDTAQLCLHGLNISDTGLLCVISSWP